jgi:hypothetical protein
MSAYVVDTNVPVVANGRTEQVGPHCIRACVAALEKVHDGGVVVLDDGLRVLGEYMDNLSMSGQPGVGDFFMKWVWENQAVTEHCERVTIAPRPDDPDSFEEFPQDPDLASFDRSDRKFVALALASQLDPTILNAVDSDWWDYGPALARHGVVVENLCPDHRSTAR